MNRIKLSIKDNDGNTICKIGSSIAPPQDDEYSDAELATFLHELARMLEAPAIQDLELDEFEPGTLSTYLKTQIDKISQ